MILLDFDGVLFDTLPEVYFVCQELARQDKQLRQDVTFAEFRLFRQRLTDAWQFSILYEPIRANQDWSCYQFQKPSDSEARYANDFFRMRASLPEQELLSKVVPCNFFRMILPLIEKYPYLFKIVSTRNEASIKKIMERFCAKSIEIFGQEAVRRFGSKQKIILENKFNKKSIYIDDMIEHLMPMRGVVDQLMHANWGYDPAISEMTVSDVEATKTITMYLEHLIEI